MILMPDEKGAPPLRGAFYCKEDMMRDLYEYQRVPPREARETDEKGNVVPLGNPEEYEDLAAYLAHKALLEKCAYAKAQQVQ
jgi:hypothetical protein